jgi:hypothetical protein
MLKFLYPLLLVLLFSHGAYAQRGTVRGFVHDEKGEAIPGILILLKSDSAKFNSVSGPDGKFEIEIPSDRPEVLIVKRFSARSEYYVRVKSGETLELDVLFNETSSFGTVEITDTKAREERIQKIELRLNTLLPNINGGIEGYLRQTIVNTPSELSSSYSVRGGSFDENLVYVNDIQVYRPFLVRAGEQEGLSFPNPDMVSSIEFSGGGFAAKYGDKMSSVLDIQYHRPDSFGGAITAGLLGGSIQLEGISKNEKFTHNSGIRYKSNTYVLNTLDTQGDYDPRYTDFQTYLTYSPQKYGPLEFSFLGNYARNRYNFIPQTRETDAGSINEALRLTVFFEGQEVTQFETFFGAFATRYNPSESSQLKFIFSAFKTYESETFDILGAYSLDELERDLGSDEFGEVLVNRGVGAFLEHARNNLNASVLNFTHKGFAEVNKHNTMHWGLEAQMENVYDELKEWTLIDSSGYASPNRPDSIGYTDPDAQGQGYIFLHDRIRAVNDISSFRSSAYVQNTRSWENKKGENFSLNTGVRANYWSFNDEVVYSPRINFSYSPEWMKVRKDEDGNPKDSVKKDIVLTAAVGYYYQPPFYREMRGFDGSVNEDIRAQKSIHYIVGANYVLRLWDRPFKMVTEAYYKQLDNLIPYELENVRQRYFATNNSKGYAYGADILLNGEFIKDVQSWMRLSFLKTEEDITDDFYYIRLNADGDTIVPGYTIDPVAVDSILQVPGYVARPTDQRISFSMLFQDEMKRWPQNKILLNFYFATGLPYGPPSQERYLDVLRTRSYIRADVGFSRDLITAKAKKEGKNWFTRNLESGTVSLEVFNLMGNNNIINHQWIEDINGRQYSIPTYLTGRRLNVRIGVRF